MTTAPAPHTVVVLSGGMDSTVALALHHALGHRLTAVTVDYGQRHAKEIQAAAQVADHYLVAHIVVPMAPLGQHLASALTTAGTQVPEGHYADESMKATVVPNRNAILANVAVGVAVAHQADTVVLGVHAGDHAVYPDCRPAFIDHLNALVAVATEGLHTPRVAAPFVHASKTEIARLGGHLDAPLHLTWSCYNGGDLHCGKCGTCYERREAFRDAGITDPTQYATA